MVMVQLSVHARERGNYDEECEEHELCDYLHAAVRNATGVAVMFTRATIDNPLAERVGSTLNASASISALTLWRSSLEAGSLHRLLQADFSKQIHAFTLYHCNGLSGQDVAALLRLERLSFLGLFDSGIVADVILQALLQITPSNLEGLSLQYNPLGDTDACAAMVACLLIWLPHLRSLFLENCGIGDRVLSRLGDDILPDNDSLERLSLSNNPDITTSGLERLKQGVSRNARLTRICLRSSLVSQAEYAVSKEIETLTCGNEQLADLAKRDDLPQLQVDDWLAVHRKLGPHTAARDGFWKLFFDTPFDDTHHRAHMLMELYERVASIDHPDALCHSLCYSLVRIFPTEAIEGLATAGETAHSDSV